MNTVNTSKAPRPVGAYPHARRVGNLLFLSGVGPRRASDNSVPGNIFDDHGVLVAHDIQAQCAQVFANVQAVLEASGATLANLVDITVYLTDMKADFASYNAAYATFFAGIDACRTTVGIDHLPTPIAIELKCVAWIDG